MVKEYKIDERNSFQRKKFSTDDCGNMEKEEALEKMNENIEKINELQQRLYADKKEGIIFLFQAMDAAGKDGTIRAVLSCLSPHGVAEAAFKAPNTTELEHDFLWRIHQCVPAKGHIAIFNRSHYEDVLVVRVHKLYENQAKADRIKNDTLIEKRYEDIRNFEEYLYNNSVRIVKIYLNVSKKEQARRFLSRLNEPEKNWKFEEGDVKQRPFWDEYQKAFDDAINKTATKHCPWYIVPADQKWYMRYVVSEVILENLKDMNPQYPEVSKEQLATIESYREELSNELEKENKK